MHITDDDIRNTLLELFARKGLVQGDVMWMSRLERFWSETGLRRGDLVTGIAALCTGGLLNMEADGDETNLSLTAEGERRALAVLDAGTRYCSRYLREELLPGLRLNAGPVRGEGSGRRGYEQPVTDIPRVR